MRSCLTSPAFAVGDDLDQRLGALDGGAADLLALVLAGPRARPTWAKYAARW